MRVSKTDLDRLRYVEREVESTHLKTVLTSVIHNIQVNNAVYVIQEEGSWDYEFTGHTEVYSTFKEALKSYHNLVKVAKQDMEEWIDSPAESEQIDEEAESAEFQIYADGDFTRLHDTITIKRQEVLENA